MATAVKVTLYDPWSRRFAHYSPAAASCLFELLSTDYFVGAAKTMKDVALLQDILMVDLEFQSHIRRSDHVDAYIPVLSHLLDTDQQVDQSRKSLGKYSVQRLVHDPYVSKKGSQVVRNNELYSSFDNNNPVQLLRDNYIFMELFDLDAKMNEYKASCQLIFSDITAIIEDLYEMDVRVSSARMRTLFAKDLQKLLDVDNFIDQKKWGLVDANDSQVQTGKRSIFTEKEKYSAKLSNSFSI